MRRFDFFKSKEAAIAAQQFRAEQFRANESGRAVRSVRKKTSGDHRRSVAGLLLVLAMLSAGCGGDGLERAPITGIVTVEGAPLPSALIQFLPEPGTPGEGALGSSDAEGRFDVISSRQSDDGIPPGEYVVRVSRLMDADGSFVPVEAPQADFPDAIESVPAPYSTINSPIKVQISSEGGEVKVEIPVPLIQKQS